MEAPRHKTCGNPMKLQRNPAYGDLQAYCPHCKVTIYPLPKASKAEDEMTDADDQQGDIEALLKREGLPCPPRRQTQ